MQKNTTFSAADLLYKVQFFAKFYQKHFFYDIFIFVDFSFLSKIFPFLKNFVIFQVVFFWKNFSNKNKRNSKTEDQFLRNFLIFVFSSCKIKRNEISQNIFAKKTKP